MTRFFLILILSAALPAALSARPAASAETSLIGVRAAADGRPLILLGITAMGPESGRTALESESRAGGFSVHRVTRDEGDETMVLFPPNASPDAAMTLLRRATAGEFGTLVLEVVVAPATAVSDGIDFATEVTAEPVTYIHVPSP